MSPHLHTRIEISSKGVIGGNNGIGLSKIIEFSPPTYISHFKNVLLSWALIFENARAVGCQFIPKWAYHKAMLIASDKKRLNKYEKIPP
jgi:hypothetical protein